MNQKIAIGILATMLAIPGAAIAADTKDGKGMDVKGSVKNAASEVKETVGDSIITTKIKAEYAKDKAVSAMNIHVDTDQKGMVVLSGNAKTKAEADKAESLAKGTQGVTSVKNNITVASDTRADTKSTARSDNTPRDTKGTDVKGTARNVGAEVKETVSDSIITTKIKAEYAKDKTVSAMNIKVDTDQKGVVVLSGNAKTKAEADKAESLAKGTQGVTSVKNNITVGATDVKSDTRASTKK